MKTSYGQGNLNLFSINAVVIDSLNKTVIPYATIFKTRDHKGTITDFNGNFHLENIAQNDEIIVSSTGYKKTKFIGNALTLYDTIYLNRELKLLDEIIILADDGILYKLISNSKKTHSTSIKKAKTYFEMETFHNSSQLELFQGYYNGTFDGYDLAKLEMKNARFGLSPIAKRIFASTETSKAMCMQKLMSSNDYFPTSPFEMSIKKLRKSYDLSLSMRYRDQNKKTIYVINFTPRKDFNDYFQGTVWIDSLTNQIIKVSNTITNTKTHPFQAIWSNHSLDKVNIEISKNFTEQNGEMFLKSVDFKYDLTYVSALDSNFTISTRAVLYAYVYDDEFILPFFNFTETSNSDYREIQMLPYNKDFWKCTDEFNMKSNSEERDYFLNEIATIKVYNLFTSDTLFNRNFFENPYVAWSKNRILFREETSDSVLYNLAQGTIPSQRYNLEVQLFMDINLICDSLQIITKTIFDPYVSYYKYPTSIVSQAFINIYFDLVEIERRKLELEISKCNGDIDLIKLRYFDSKRSIEKISEDYFKEVERGTKKAALKKWNDVVFKELNIDNMILFKIE